MRTPATGNMIEATRATQPPLVLGQTQRTAELWEAIMEIRRNQAAPMAQAQRVQRHQPTPARVVQPTPTPTGQRPNRAAQPVRVPSVEEPQRPNGLPHEGQKPQT